MGKLCRTLWIYLLASIFTPRFLFACPLCHTATAEEVRLKLESTASDPQVLMALILPFVILAVVIVAINIEWSSLKRK